MAILIKFKQDYAGHAKGKELKLEHQLASTLINGGICEKVAIEDERPKKVTPKIEVAKEVIEDSKTKEETKPKKRGRKSSN